MRLLKLSMTISITKVVVAPKELETGPLSAEDLKDIADAAAAENDEPSVTVNSVVVDSAEVIEV